VRIILPSAHTLRLHLNEAHSKQSITLGSIDNFVFVIGMQLVLWDIGARRKITGIYGGDYEECCLLGYKNAVHTSQETHCTSATEPSPLMLSNF
jgi:hypothetical protein